MYSHKLSVQRRVKVVIATEIPGINAGLITNEQRLIEDIGADSLDIIEIYMAIEEEFKSDKIQFTEHECLEIKTVGELISKVKAKIPDYY